MSSVLQRLRPDNSTSRTRLLMVGAVLGAVAALFISMTVASSQSGAPRDGGGPGPQGGGPAAPDAQDGTKYAFDAKVGACLMWERDDGADMREVSCEKPHVFEVTEVINVSKTYLAGAPLPDTGTWRTLAQKRCTKGAERYLDRDLDPAGKLKVSALRPNEHNWKRGSRELRCGLWRIGPGGSLQPTVDRAADINQSDVWAAGTCLGLAGKSVGDPVNCENKHSYEMISVVNLSDEFDSYPSTGKQNAYLDKTCVKASRSYSGGKDLKKLKLIVAWDTRSKASWKAGSHLVNCKVAALLADKSGLAPVTGGIAATAEDKKKAGEKKGTKPSSSKSTTPSSKPAN